MSNDGNNNGKSFLSRFEGVGYGLIDKSGILSGIVRRGGIKFKWAVIISLITVVIVFMFGMIFSAMTSSALISANDKLCKTIAGNISSAENILTAETRPLKRSLILQDLTSGLMKSNIPGLEYAAVYDLGGKLSDRKESYAAHTESFRRGWKIPRDVLDDIKNVEEFQKKKIAYERKDKSSVICYEYRLPFRFFNIKVGVIEIVFSEESILGPVRKAQLFILIPSFLLLIFGIFISIYISGGMVKPIRELAGGMNRVKDGDLTVNMDINRHDEIGDLSNEFNNMIQHLREKLQMQKFVSKSTMSMIKEKSAGGEIGLGGKRENLAFLFSDVRGFTAMSEKMQPEEVVEILNQYLDLQAQIIKNQGGDIDKFVGDEVMAVFSGPDKASRAMKAAIEIMEAIREFNKEREDSDLRTVNVGIGINMGDVVHGRMGSRDRMDNTSIGDAVNLAARLCSHAEPGSVLVSKEVIAEAPKGKFTGKKLEPIRVKGKAKPIPIFAVTGYVK
ncbi:MAG: HAMP domain-containing protein [Spirochaetes bacterium]|jgi:adenylate cyclase|nr:HAMP domain-containing protein [Spirochaetota bacterium]